MDTGTIQLHCSASKNQKGYNKSIGCHVHKRRYDVACTANSEAPRGSIDRVDLNTVDETMKEDDCFDDVDTEDLKRRGEDTYEKKGVYHDMYDQLSPF